MKLSKIILLCIVTIVMVIDLNASRVKKDLLSSKEDEIIVLLKEKIAIVDKLIVEAKIYKNEKDPFIQKDFYGTPNAFVTKVRKNSRYVQTDIDTSVLAQKKKSGRISSNKISIPRGSTCNTSQKRDIFGIKMRLKSDSRALFTSNINFSYLLKTTADMKLIRVKNKTYKKKSVQIFDNTYETKFQSLTTELLQKYSKLISLLSINDIGKNLNDMIKTNSAKNWSIYSRLLIFQFSLNYDKFFKKKTYDLSEELNNIFNRLCSKENMKLTGVPSYYDKKINKNLRCLETAENIKYKGRICINPVDVDKDRYFENGIFETRENNFLQRNREYFGSLREIDKKLQKELKEYIEFIVLKVSSLTKKSEINLEGGL